jgi:hypothetical protein
MYEPPMGQPLAVHDESMKGCTHRNTLRPLAYVLFNNADLFAEFLQTNEAPEDDQRFKTWLSLERREHWRNITEVLMWFIERNGLPPTRA